MKKIVSIIISIIMLFSCFPVCAFANSSVVYTGNNSSAGNGTIDNPYSSLVDAIESVSDGGTIYIKGGSYSFVNDIGEDKPLIIDKSITITTEPNANEKGAISTRSAGILLKADVVFSNIDIGLASKYHNAICANGYSLVLDNVGRYTGHRIMNVFAGGMADSYGNPYNEPGNHARVTITGGEYQNVYAGGLNCSYDQDVEININGSSDMKLGKSYSCGAVESYVDRNDWFDFTDPNPPTANPTYVTNNVTWNIYRGVSRYIDAQGSHSTTVNVSVNPNARDSNTCFYGIDQLNVIEGVLEPAHLDNGASLGISKNATLDLQSISDYECNNFDSNGRLVLDTYGSLIINGNVNGITAFETKNGYDNSSGIVIANHTYISATNSNADSFTFNPNAAQEDYTLDFENGLWTANSNYIAEDNLVNSIAFGESEMKFTQDDVNSYLCSIPLTIETVEDGDASYYDYTYTVRVKGKEYISQADLDYLGVAYIDELNMEFFIYSDVVDGNVTEAFIELGPRLDSVSAGEYEITISNGSASDTMLLVVTGDKDYSALNAVIDFCDTLSPDDYSKASFDNLMAVVEECQQISAINQQDIDNAVETVLSGIYSLEPYFNLTVKSTFGGTSSMKGSYSFLKGTTVNLVASSSDGYSFIGWYDTLNNRYFTSNLIYQFDLVSNVSIKPIFAKNDSVTLTFANDSGWVKKQITKTAKEWANAELDSLLPAVPYQFGSTNGRWNYNEIDVLQRLISGEDVTITPLYDACEIEAPAITDTPTLYYNYDTENEVQSFVMTGDFKGLNIADIGIAFYFSKADDFNPNSYILTLNNKSVCSRFSTESIDDSYIVDITNTTLQHGICARGYVTYYDMDNTLKTIYTNQINVE